MLLKAKHVLFRIVEGTGVCTQSHKTTVTVNRFQRYCSADPAREFLSSNPTDRYENVVSLDPSEVKEEPQETPRSRVTLSDLEKKYFSNRDHENTKSHESRNNFTNLYKNVKKNEAFFRDCVIRLNSKKRRKKENKILIDNVKIIKDAIGLGFQPTAVFYTRASVLETLNLDPSIKKLRVSYKQIQLWSDVASSQGIIGVFEKPSNKLEINENYSGSIPLTIICDDIRDPKNMGSMLRVAASVGCRKFILTKGCVDIWNEKVIRAAAGAHFQFPYLYVIDWDNMEKEISEECKVFLADSNAYPKNSENADDTEMNDLKKDFKVNLPKETFYSTSFGNQDVAIIVGNEGMGLSENAYLFTQKRKGLKIYIPLFNNINSLNSAVALGILVYEVRRQFEKSQTVSISQ